jgi:hypothetical protein
MSKKFNDTVKKLHQTTEAWRTRIFIEVGHDIIIEYVIDEWRWEHYHIYQTSDEDTDFLFQSKNLFVDEIDDIIDESMWEIPEE